MTSFLMLFATTDKGISDDIVVANTNGYNPDQTAFFSIFLCGFSPFPLQLSPYPSPIHALSLSDSLPLPLPPRVSPTFCYKKLRPPLPLDRIPTPVHLIKKAFGCRRNFTAEAAEPPPSPPIPTPVLVGK
ncbi:hypothetical protein TIFTF001_011963 [Ficus carica]|uniref:Uncharacterized protein n=1 Tax=Ficus carica TaxID=3494 RepID=A0AA88A0X3_FICCA|nr:hypothetical protein TIFTF001_011963 [Ficus carica]